MKISPTLTPTRYCIPRSQTSTTYVVDVFSNVNLPQVVSPKRRSPVSNGSSNPSSTTKPKSPKQLPGSVPSTLILGCDIPEFGEAAVKRNSISHLMQTPQPFQTGLFGLQGLSPKLHGLSPTRQSSVGARWVGDSCIAGNQAEGSATYVTRVLRAPQDNFAKPCDIKAIQIRESRIVTLSPGSLRFWDLVLEDNSSGLVIDIAPVSLFI